MTNQWKFTIISVNVNGVATDMWTKLRNLHKGKYDIILLQETKLKDADLNDNLRYRWKQISDGEAFVSHAASAQEGGVAILLSAYACSVLTDRDQLPVASDKHRQIIVSASMGGQKVFIQSIYAPARRAERPTFFENLTNPPGHGSHIIGGDFNCVLDATHDTIGDRTLASTGSAELITWISSINAIDAWRIRHEDKSEYTSPSGLSRIDMILLSGCFTNNFNAQHNPRTIGSDHMVPQVITQSCDITAAGGHWQLPTWLARNAHQRIKQTLESLASVTDAPNYFTLFEKAMTDITGQCKAVHKRALRWRKDKIERARLRWLRAHHSATASPTPERIADAEAARSVWIKEMESAAAQKRARAFDSHFAEAERCTAFFLRRPRKKNVSVIPGVRTQNGSVSNEPNRIQSEHKTYWSTLYSADSGGRDNPITDDNITNLVNTNLPSLPHQYITQLEQPITEEDIVKQINRLPNNKAAGSDGLRAELMKLAPKIWAKILLPIFETHLHQHNQLPPSFRESIIILLHKKGCSYQPKNYRPIALLNVIAKVLSGIHNDRLRRALPLVIPPEQTGFIPNRSITENIVLLQDSIYYSKRHHPSSVILSLDFEKAYDRVQWRVMHAIIKKLNFGPRWRKIIETMYRQRSARLSINGELSAPFNIERGVLQGDPLSPALFILQCSPLYSKLNELKASHGIPLPDNSVAPVATFYADDTNIIARSPACAVSLYNAAKWFCTNSGAKIHPEKCIAIATGPAPPQLSNGIKILNPTDDTTILGVAMGRSITRQQQTQKVLAKMLSRCNNFAHIGRTIEGRITVARAMILSTVWYVLGALPTNASETKKIQSVIYNYINGCEEQEWDGTTKRGNLGRHWFHRTKKEGGWNLAPVIRTLRARKLSMIRQFMADDAKGAVKPWHTFMRVMLEELLHNWGAQWRDFLFWNGLHRQGEFAIGNWDALSPWWREAWQEWLKLRCAPARNSLHLNQLKYWPVWNNRVIATNHGTPSVLHKSFTNSTTRAHMREFRRQGFLAFHDFMNTDGSIMSGHALYTAVTVRLSVNQSDHVIPLHACESLSRLIQALWANTRKNWQSQSAHNAQPPVMKWYPAASPSTSFSSTKNVTITKLIATSEPTMPQPKLIRLFNRPITLNWCREHAALKQLAPSRRDLLMRLVRNALPLGIKRVHWSTGFQTKCLLCHTNTTETANHMLWVCGYAKETWGGLQTPWRNEASGNVGWKETLLGHEVRLDANTNKVSEQMWAIIRGCVIRMIWMERNRRYFYPELPAKPASFRHNMAVADIKAHMEAWYRRCNDDTKPILRDALTLLASRSNTYNTIQIRTPVAPGSPSPNNDQVT